MLPAGPPSPGGIYVERLHSSLPSLRAVRSLLQTLPLPEVDHGYCRNDRRLRALERTNPRLGEGRKEGAADGRGGGRPLAGTRDRSGRARRIHRKETGPAALAQLALQVHADAA